MTEIRTWHEVAEWLPTDIRARLERALPPKTRGWYTRDEAYEDGGRFVEMQTMSEREPRLYRTGD